MDNTDESKKFKQGGRRENAGRRKGSGRWGLYEVIAIRLPKEYAEEAKAFVESKMKEPESTPKPDQTPTEAET